MVSGQQPIAFVSASKGMYDMGLWTVETGEIKWLTKSDRESRNQFFQPRKKLAYTVNSGGDIKLVVHDIENKGNQ